MTKQSERKLSMPTDKLAAQMRAVATATDDFAVLIRSSGLDPGRHLRFADWSGVDFANSDLRGFDFTGSRLIGCNFSGALIRGARFDHAEIDRARPHESLAASRTNLRLSKDWAAYLQEWSPESDVPRDDHLPVGAVFQDAPFAPEMVVVPQGQFMMGSPPEDSRGKGSTSEGPQRAVRIERPFAVSRFPVTFGEYVTSLSQRYGEYFASLPQGQRPSKRSEGASRPAVDVTWDTAVAYTVWLESLTGKPYRLLSEAEWEYCCRAGTVTAYSTGNRIARDQACFDAESLVKVGTYAGNAWGLHDFHGSVWEWCLDDRHDTYYGAPQDGSAWVTRMGSRRKVTRGGCWQSQPEDIRSAARYASRIDTKNEIIGFRVARDLEE